MQHFLLTQQAPGVMDLFGPIILMVVVFYFIFMRPQKKREKEAAQMRKDLEIGDEVVTNGGIIGRVASIRDDSILMESGSSNTKIRIAKWAVQTNMTAQEAAKERMQEAAKTKKGKTKDAKPDKEAMPDNKNYDENADDEKARDEQE